MAPVYYATKQDTKVSQACELHIQLAAVVNTGNTTYACMITAAVGSVGEWINCIWKWMKKEGMI